MDMLITDKMLYEAWLGHRAVNHLSYVSFDDYMLLEDKTSIIIDIPFVVSNPAEPEPCGTCGGGAIR